MYPYPWAVKVLNSLLYLQSGVFPALKMSITINGILKTKFEKNEGYGEVMDFYDGHSLWSLIPAITSYCSHRKPGKGQYFPLSFLTSVHKPNS